jgi:hypothetical protein
MRLIAIGALMSVVLAMPAHAVAQTARSYKILATAKTSTMEKEMQQAGAAGFRFLAVMGGETAAGGKEVVVLMERTSEPATHYEYRLLATLKTSTLQKELQAAADAGWYAVGQTVFESMMGGKETAGILERNPDAPASVRYDYRLIATSKTSTLEKELREAAEQGYEAIGLTVGKTALGGAELVVITRKPVKGTVE